MTDFNYFLRENRIPNSREMSARAVKEYETRNGRITKDGLLDDFSKVLGDCVTTEKKLFNSILNQFTLQGLDYTNTFDLLTKSLTSDSVSDQLTIELEQCFEPWQKRVREQDASTEEIQKTMRQHNPVVIPRNHHIEAVIQECEETGEARSAEKFLDVLRCPYKETSQTPQFQTPPDDRDQHYKTFCGT